MRRAAVTGIGAVTPLGLSAEETWKGVLASRSGIGRITKFDPKDLPTCIAGEVRGFSPEPYIHKKEIKKMDLFIQYAIASAVMAVRDSGLEFKDGLGERTGVIVGVGLGGLPGIERFQKVLETEGHRRVSPFFIPMVIGNLAGGYISMMFNLKGKNMCTTTACASGSHAIGEALRCIRSGEMDAAICGGAESTITALAVAGFGAMRALSERNPEPERASRPFDRGRDGFVLAEGAGILVVEEMERARARGATIYCELAGYGATADAHHITAPPPDGEGAVRCMELAMKDAAMNRDEVDYINAHGTSTQTNDAIETVAIKRVFGDHARRVAVSSTKSMTGHMLGAAGGVEAAITALAMRESVAPPTINYEEADPECDLDYVPNTAREMRIRGALSNSFGFGGTNASLAFKAVGQEGR